MIRSFPQKLEGGTISPLRKKGNQAEPANYLPVSFLSHARKTIDTTILTYVCDYFTSQRTQFGLQPGISVEQAILQAQSSVQHGQKHVAVLDLHTSYDKLNKHHLLRMMAEYLHDDILHVVPATIGAICWSCSPKTLVAQGFLLHIAYMYAYSSGH